MATFNQTGTATGGKTPYTIAWTQKAGPSNATITTPNAVSTGFTITGGQYGDYEFELSGTDAKGTKKKDQFTYYYVDLAVVAGQSTAGVSRTFGASTAGAASVMPNDPPEGATYEYLWTKQ